MKKISVIAAALALFVGCNKVENPANGGFVAGEKVTICASSDSQTKANGLLNDQDKIAFTWEDGDKIRVSIGSASSVFTLISGAGTANATFEGIMPADGSSFDVQFPDTESILSSQNYVENGLPHNLMKATATGCTLDQPVNLKAANTALRLNLYGKDQTVGKIVITDNSVSPSISYTLNSPDTGVALNAYKSESKPFFAVLPSGSRKFKVDVYDNAATKALICSFETANAQTFNAGDVLVMPAKKVKAADPAFSVSATKTVKFTKADIYWDGSELKFEPNQYARTLSYNANHIAHFYYSTDLAVCVGTAIPALTNGQACYFSESEGGVTVEGESGLYLLTADEWKYLFGVQVTGRSKSLWKCPVNVCGSERCLVIAPDGYKKTIQDSYDAEQWAAAEAEGLVCLANTGRRYQNRNMSDSDSGHHMCATVADANGGPEFVYSYSNAGVGHPCGNGYGYCVRLVKNNVPVEDIDGGTIDSMTGANGSW